MTFEVFSNLYEYMIEPKLKTYLSDYNCCRQRSTITVFISVALERDILFCPTGAEDHLIIVFQSFIIIRIIQSG